MTSVHVRKMIVTFFPAVTLCCSLWLATAEQNLAVGVGPYTPQTYFRAIQCPVPNDTLYLTITLPVESGKANPSKYPLVLFINGFVLRSCVYAPYANRLASYGYAVLQYDDSKNPLSDFQSAFSDSARVKWIDSAIECVKQQVAFAGSIDFDTTAVVGHSRGAKLAGMYYSENYKTSTTLKSAYLIDPIDTPTNSSEKCISFFPDYNPDSYPNLAHLLNQSVPPVALSASALTSKCNCNSSNYWEIWPAAPLGSWLSVVQQAGHLQITDDSLASCGGESWWVRAMLKTVYVNPGRVPGIGKYLSQWTCSKGNITTTEAIDLVATPMVAWLEATVKGKPLSDFEHWVKDQEAKGSLTFEVKKGQESNTQVA